VPSQGEKIVSSVLLATMTNIESNELNLKSENDAWPVSLFAPQGLPFMFPVFMALEG
jgi:hypothetical protein